MKEFQAQDTRVVTLAWGGIGGNLNVAGKPDPISIGAEVVIYVDVDVKLIHLVKGPSPFATEVRPCVVSSASDPPFEI